MLLSYRTWSPVTSTVYLLIIDHKILLLTHPWWYELGICGCLDRIHNYQEYSAGSVSPTNVAGHRPFCRDAQSSTIEVECCNLGKTGTHFYTDLRINKCRPKSLGPNNSTSFLLVFYQFLWRWCLLPSWPWCWSPFIHLQGIPLFLKSRQRTQWLEFVSKYCDWNSFRNCAK